MSTNMAGFVPSLPPPMDDKKTVLLSRAARIPSSQKRILEEDSSWLSSDCKPDPDHMMVPDRVLKYVQLNWARESEESEESSKQPAMAEQEMAASQPSLDKPIPVAEKEPVLEKTTDPVIKETDTAVLPEVTPAVTTEPPVEAPKYPQVAPKEPETTEQTTTTPIKNPPSAPAQSSQKTASAPGEIASSPKKAVLASREANQRTSTPEAVVIPEKTVPLDAQSSPPVTGLREQSPDDWPNQLPSEDDDNRESVTESGNESDSDKENDRIARGEEPLLKDKEDQQLPQPQQAAHQVPSVSSPAPVPAAPPTQDMAPLSQTKTWVQRQSPYHGRSPDLGSSSPLPIDVDLPDILGGRLSASRPPSSRRGIYSQTVDDVPSSSPTPKEPRSAMLSTSETVEQRNTGVTNKTQPPRRLMKPPVFPPKAPLQTKPPVAGPGQVISLNPSRVPSLTRPPKVQPPVNDTGLATSDLVTSPVATPHFQRTDIHSREVAAHEPVSNVQTPVPAPSNVGPTPTTSAVTASSPPILAPSYNNTPASGQMSTKSASSAVSRTWMMPYETFTGAYPDYEGDLEEFLRACYSLQHISPGSLPDFVFDDIVHMFWKYIDYVQNTVSGTPQNLTQWYSANATDLVHNQKVVTRANLGNILKAYPTEVKALGVKATLRNTQHPSSPATVSEDRTREGAVISLAKTPAKPTPIPHHISHPGTYESPPPGRPFPPDSARRRSPTASSMLPNSMLQHLDVPRASNTTDIGNVFQHGRFGQSLSSLSQSQSQSQSQDREQPQNMSRQADTGFGPTQSSSWDGSQDLVQLDVPSSPIPSSEIPPGMDRRHFLLQSQQPVWFARRDVPPPQVHAAYPESSIAETPARPLSSRKRSHHEVRERQGGSVRIVPTPNRPAVPTPTPRKRAPKPATNIDGDEEDRKRSYYEVRERQGGSVRIVPTPNRPAVPTPTPKKRTPKPATNIDGDEEDRKRSHHEVRERQGGSVRIVPTPNRPAVPTPTPRKRAPEPATNIDDDEEDDFETSMLSVQSAAEVRIPPAQPPKTAPSGISKERRRATIAASDIGMAARMAAAEERVAVAPKRVLPASMAREAASGQPPKKKKKKVAKQSFAEMFGQFLKEQVGPKRA